MLTSDILTHVSALAPMLSADTLTRVFADLTGEKSAPAPVEKPAEKAPYVYDKGDFTPAWRVEKVTTVDGTTIYRIAHAFTVNRCVKKAISAAVQATKPTKSGKVEYISAKTGKKGGYTAYGFGTKAAADKALAALPAVLTADTIALYDDTHKA